MAEINSNLSTQHNLHPTIEFSNQLTLTVAEVISNNIISSTKSSSFTNSNSASNESPLLSLPLEILFQIFELTYYDNETNSISVTLENFSKTIPLLSKTINKVSQKFLYRYAIFNRPHSFDKFLDNLINSPELGLHVHVMDFQQFTSVGLGRTNKMNQEIQMVTSTTILNSLTRTPNIMEFLASENIQDDIDYRVLNHLFNESKHLKSIDFCGATGLRFSDAFDELAINNPIQSLSKVSLHDCTGLSPNVFEKILQNLPNLKRLDLSHTQITSKVLFHSICESSRITHLSLARCSKITTRDLIDFFTLHASVTNNSLKWLNLQIDSSVVSPLNSEQLYYLLTHLKAKDLKYLNLGGLPIEAKHLLAIKKKFPLLESINLSFAHVDPTEINDFLSGTIIKCIDLTGNKKISRWNFTSVLKNNYENLIAVEFDYKILMDLSCGAWFNVHPETNSYLDPVEITSWRFYDNEGRRAWIYKLDPNDPESKNLNQGDITFYDLKTGKKITKKQTKPVFLKYVSRKINCSTGYFNDINGKINDVWPVAYSQRGIYNYYSLNTK